MSQFLSALSIPNFSNYSVSNKEDPLKLQRQMGLCLCMCFGDVVRLGGSSPSRPCTDHSHNLIYTYYIHRPLKSPHPQCPM